MERLKALPSLEGIPVIVVTARDLAGERERIASAGAEAVFHEPFEHERLLAAVQASLGEPPGR